jgi:hypothetical protein
MQDSLAPRVVTSLLACVAFPALGAVLVGGGVHAPLLHLQSLLLLQVHTPPQPGVVVLVFSQIWTPPVFGSSMTEWLTPLLVNLFRTDA